MGPTKKEIVQNICVSIENQHPSYSVQSTEHNVEPWTISLGKSSPIKNAWQDASA